MFVKSAYAVFTQADCSGWVMWRSPRTFAKTHDPMIPPPSAGRLGLFQLSPRVNDDLNNEFEKN